MTNNGKYKQIMQDKQKQKQKNKKYIAYAYQLAQK